LRKYISACQESTTPYIAITWDRLLENKPISPMEVQYMHKAPYGKECRRKNFVLYIGWVFFALYNLIKVHKQYKVIHACNIETIWVAYILKLLFRKKIVFDIYDTSGKYALERFFAKRSDLFILPHELRAKQIGFENLPANLFVVENVPYFQDYEPQCVSSNTDGRLHISYVGVFQRRIRGIENLLKLVENNTNVFCDIAGSGDGLEDDIIELSKRCDRIKYHGTVRYNEALDIMDRSDIMFACYYLNARTHKYASPNKYYESLFLAKPLITTKNTLVGERVKQGNTGFVIGDTYEELEALVANFGTEGFEQMLKEKAARAVDIWKNTYSLYFEKHMKSDYIQKCSGMVQ
jgi:glycosyltransferase involved in cell wall biosynthesis